MRLERSRGPGAGSALPCLEIRHARVRFRNPGAVAYTQTMGCIHRACVCWEGSLLRAASGRSTE